MLNPEGGSAQLSGAIAPRVLITNATRLHAHHHAYALQKAGILQRFVTSIWWKRSCFPYRSIGLLPGSLRSRVESFLSKRRHAGIRDDLVEQRWVIELIRMVADAATRGRFRDWILFAHKGAHDRLTARRVARLKPDVVVGYEISCSRTFARARSIGALTVLDLAGLHHDFTHGVATRFKLTSNPPRLQRMLGERKRRELELADRILVISELARTTLLDAGIAKDRISVVRLGVALETFKPKEVYRSNGPFRILFVGNLSRAKGADVLLEAFAALDRPGCELTLVGPRGDAYYAAQERPGCTHIPYLDHARLAELYRDADIFVLPTLYDSWGLVVTEAMASGTPVIVTDHCGAKELVSPDCGWIVAPGDAAALVNTLRTAFDDRGRLSEMGRQARAKVESLDWDAYHRNVAARVTHLWRDMATTGDAQRAQANAGATAA